MSGVKGKSGGYRPGAGRKPSASTITKKAKAKAKKDQALGGAVEAPLSNTTKFKKLTSFFSAKPTTDTVSSPQPYAFARLPSDTIPSVCCAGIGAAAVQSTRSSSSRSRAHTATAA